MGELKGLSEAQLTQHARPERLCFLADLMKHLKTLSLKPEGKGRALVSGYEELRLKPGM